MLRTIASFIAIALLGSCGARDGGAAGPEVAKIGDAPVQGAQLRGVGLEDARLIAVRTDGARLRGEPVERIALIDDQVVLADRPLTEQDVRGLHLVGALADEREISLVVVEARADDGHRYRLLARDTFGNFTSVCASFGRFARGADGLQLRCEDPS